MILYHGTPIKKARKIMQDGIIKSHIKRNYIDYNDTITNTTDGYVYLTTNIYTAYYYGNINSLSQVEEDSYVCIFKIDVNDKVLLPDYDEIKVKCKNANTYEKITYNESINMCGCVTIKNDLEITNSDYIILPNTGNYIDNENSVQLCQELSKLQSKSKSNIINQQDIDNLMTKIEKNYEWHHII